MFSQIDLDNRKISGDNDTILDVIMMMYHQNSNSTKMEMATQMATASAIVNP